MVDEMSVEKFDKAIRNVSEIGHWCRDLAKANATLGNFELAKQLDEASIDLLNAARDITAEFGSIWGARANQAMEASENMMRAAMTGIIMGKTSIEKDVAP